LSLKRRVRAPDAMTMGRQKEGEAGAFISIGINEVDK
jgi:hypothetical protein